MRTKLLLRASMLFTILAVLSFVIYSCTQPLGNPTNNNNNGLTGSITGKVVTTNNAALSGVQVSIGNLSGITDAQGGFFIANVPAGDRVIISFKSDNYASTQKIVTVKANRTSYVDAAMLTVGIKQNLNGTSGGSVAFSGAKIDFPANSLVNSTGSAFTGTALVNATYFDPTNAVFYGCFPGEFMGTRTDNSQTQIESFGFINVEILNGTEKLQLASGKQATVTMPIPAKLQGKAPASIPLWYYDETQGKWLEQGTANKVGNTYVGTVSHFSSWNCDMPTKTSYLQGKVVDKNGDPVSFATV
ncbi:MAG: carboxypeptidase-like regulatory domain-containing protein, partial [FCB group bacterium]